MMQTLILCGGQGTRIRGVAEDIPKPMLRIGNNPILWHIMRGYAHYGFDSFVLLLGYRGDVIKEYFLNYRAMTSDVALTVGKPDSIEYLSSHGEDDWRVVLANTGQEAMTGARVFRGARYVEGNTFFATYGDGVADINLGALLEHHKSQRRLATLTAVRPPGRFGDLILEEDRVVEFDEKPEVTEGYINGGFFVFEREFVEQYLRDDDSLSLEREPLRDAARDGQLSVYRHTGFWQPMDTYREWRMLDDLWKSGKAPWHQS